jgi:CRP/FNR family transcriptional regulator, anaerobic regulatory protein
MSKEIFNLLDFVDHLFHGNKNDLITMKKVKSGDVIIKQDELIRFVYFIKSGSVKSLITQDNGKNYILDFLGVGHPLGELGFANSSRSYCSVVALTDVEVYKLKLPYVEELMKNYPVFTFSLLKSLGTRLQNTAERASYQQTYPAEFGFLKYLLLSKESLDMSKQDIAEYLGITKRNLNRKLRLFLELHILTISNGKLTLSSSNPESLFRKLESHKTRQ